MKKKFLCLILALAMLLSLAACGGNNNTPAEPTDPTPPAADDTTTPSDDGTVEFQPYTYDDETVYMAALGDFYEAYQKAQLSETQDELYALSAIAEAKLLESGTMLPYYGRGGNYAISRMVPRSVPNIMWGSDSNRYEKGLVVDNFINAEDRAAIIALWNEKAGTGEFEQAAKDYVTEKGYTLKDTYNMGYSSDPESWDVLATWTSSVSEVITNTVDNLVHYDMEGVMQPALAESWEESEDGLTYTFHLRDAVWTDSQGRKLDDVKADDWVASMQHVLDNNADSAAEIFCGVIEGAEEYVGGEIQDFSQVGISAPDDKTVVYTLKTPAPWFLSALTYCGIGAPLCRSYYTSQGGEFGLEASAGTYGTGPNNIAYCGPYLITNWTAQNTFVFDASDSYWDRDNMNIVKFTWLFNDGTDVLKAYNDAVSGVLDGAGLNASVATKCKEDGLFEDYAYISATQATSFMGNHMLNRQSYNVFNDATKGISPMSHDSLSEIDVANGVVTTDIEDDAAHTHLAMNNQNFRLALCLGLDRASFHAQSVGEDLKTAALRNSYVPATFARLENETTVDINGTATTFAAGSYYGEILQAQITADGYPMKVWDPTAQDGAGSGDGYDGWYNPSAAKEYLNKAIEELAAQGLEVSAENPIQMDYYYQSSNESATNQANAYKQSIETTLEGCVQVNLVGLEAREDWLYTGYWINVGADACFDVAFISGWSADYADPGSYLSTMMPYSTGYVTKNLGLWG